MGTLFYGAAKTSIEIDDRILAHLQMIVVTKLRRHESFALTWRDDPSVGDGRSAVWISPNTDLFFKYSGGRMPAIDEELLNTLATKAGSSQGLSLMDSASLKSPPHR